MAVCACLAPVLSAESPTAGEVTTIETHVADGTAVETVRDEFDGDFDLKWNILRKDHTHYSLTSHEGELAVTTQAGSMFANNENEWTPAPKNVFLLHKAILAGQDFDATLQVNWFDPNKHFQQISMLVYQSDEHYLKWEMSRREQGNPLTNLAIVVESNNIPQQGDPRPTTVDGPFWLRVGRRGDEYQMSYSNDGDEFEVIYKRKWTLDPKAKRPRVGFVAKNGNPLKDETTVVLESFELKRFPTEVVP